MTLTAGSGTDTAGLSGDMRCGPENCETMADETLSSWQRLKALLENHQNDILERESSCSGNSIYLYDTGEYWVAFERSAFRLRQIFPDSDIAVLHLKTCSCPVVMVSVSGREFTEYPGRYALRPSGAGRMVLSGEIISQARYARWHRDIEEGTI